MSLQDVATLAAQEDAGAVSLAEVSGFCRDLGVRATLRTSAGVTAGYVEPDGSYTTLTGR